MRQVRPRKSFPHDSIIISIPYEALTLSPPCVCVCTASLDTEGVHDEACCGFDPPRHCHKPEYLQRTMREYYPQTTYHLANTDLATGQVKLSPVHV
jgi:hypothetical protein